VAVVLAVAVAVAVAVAMHTHRLSGAAKPRLWSPASLQAGRQAGSRPDKTIQTPARTHKSEHAKANTPKRTRARN
jgi:hypothetical protein